MQARFNCDAAPAEAICTYCGKLIRAGEKCVAIANFGRTVVKGKDILVIKPDKLRVRLASDSFKIELAMITPRGFKGSEAPMKFYIEPEIKVYHTSCLRAWLESPAHRSLKQQIFRAASRPTHPKATLK